MIGHSFRGQVAEYFCGSSRAVDISKADKQIFQSIVMGLSQRGLRRRMLVLRENQSRFY